MQIKCSGCATAIAVPANAAGKKVKCPRCQAVLAVPADSSGNGPQQQRSASRGATAAGNNAASVGKLVVNCPHCSKRMQVPAAAAGKKVACPGCKQPFAVPANAVPAAAAGVSAPVSAPAQQQRVAAGVTNAPAGAASSSMGGFFDDLASDTDFSSLPSAPNAKKGVGGVAIPTGDGESKKRPASYYRKPGMFAIIAASINIFAFLSMAIYECVSVGRELGNAAIFAIPFMIRIGIWAFFNISANAHAVVGGLNVLKRTGMSTASITCGELFIAPLFLNAVFCFNAFENEGVSDNPWLVPIIAGCIFVAYNWSAAIWLSITLSGNQAKIDFDEYDSGELDELAEKLVNSASGGGH